MRWQPNWARVALALALVVACGGAASAKTADHHKLDKILNERAGKIGTSRVIVIFKPGMHASAEVKRLGGKVGRHLGLINGQAVELPNAVIRNLANHPAVDSLHYDRPTGGEMNRVAVTVGARAVLTEYGYTGAGVGVAVIDSGITSWHDDLGVPSSSPLIQSLNGQRVPTFVDFVHGRTGQYDDNGHGTHVAGIIAGNGFDSLGSRAGIAPSSHIVSLKVLDEHGRGFISNVIAALEWVILHKSTTNIRVVNLSVGAAVTESYRTDPLTLAAKRVVDAGVVVVTAAGNLGKNAAGELQYGAITAPGNAPWVITVGASSHEGTSSRHDDVMAGYSSRGPTAIDYTAKPDVVAPGTGVVSLSTPGSLLYANKAEYLLSGSLLSTIKPYLSLSGTSMSAPVVSGTVALMLEANPSLTPNMVKAIIQYTAEPYAGYNGLTQGAGFLNTRGAVTLSRFFRYAQPGSTLALPSVWSKQIIWGNHRLTGGVIRPNANAFQLDTTWGSTVDGDGDNLVWGTLLNGDDNLTWGTVDSLDEENLVWGTVTDEDGDNLVWGTQDDGDNLVWGADEGDENLVWGTDCNGDDCENLVWGTAADGEDNLVWGTADEDDNLVWGTNGDVDNLAWGTSSEDDNVTWGTAGEQTPLFEDPNGLPDFDQTVWERLFVTEPVAVVPVTEQNTLDQPVTTMTTTTLVGGGL